jgi:hypothetical protein
MKWVADFSRSKINDLEMVDLNSASWNQALTWLRRLDLVRLAVMQSG